MTLATRLWAAVAVAILAAGAAMGEERSWKGYEVPAYEVETRAGDVEVRRTAPQLVAEVTLRGERSAALRRGFRRLAAYIFGKNDGGAKVAMTAPVTQAAGTTIPMTAPVGQQGEGDLWTVRFAMPSSYTRETLPKPADPAIRIVEAPAERLIVTRFSGFMTPAKVRRAEALLRRFAEANGLQTVGAPRHLYYDDPFTLPWRRRNEVALAVR